MNGRLTGEEKQNKKAETIKRTKRNFQDGVDIFSLQYISFTMLSRELVSKRLFYDCKGPSRSQSFFSSRFPSLLHLFRFA
jgi:hypothetical protein